MKSITLLIPTSTPIVMNSGSPGPLTKQRIGFAWWTASFKRMKNQIWFFFFHFLVPQDIHLTSSTGFTQLLVRACTLPPFCLGTLYNLTWDWSLLFANGPCLLQFRVLSIITGLWVCVCTNYLPIELYPTSKEQFVLKENNVCEGFVRMSLQKTKKYPVVHFCGIQNACEMLGVKSWACTYCFTPAEINGR